MLYQKNFSNVLVFVTSNNGNHAQAEDVYHEAFMIVWRKIQLGDFKPENECSFNGYLVRVAQNKWIDYLRSKDYKMTIRLAENYQLQAEEPDADHAKNEYIDRIVKQIGSLDKNCKNLIRKFYYKKQSMRQIAEDFGWTEATARNNKYRCIQKLRSLVNERKS